MRKVIVFGSVSIVACALASACGGAAPPSASSPAREEVREPANIDEAQQQIAEAKAALEGRSAEKKKAETSDSNASTSSTTAPESTPKTVDKDHDGVPDSVDTKCVSPCRALASMRRAVTALCRMAGDADARCTDAKKTLEASESKVATCGC